MFWIIIEVTDFSVYLIFKFKQYKNAKIANFVCYDKSRMVMQTQSMVLSICIAIDTMLYFQTLWERNLLNYIVQAR